MEIFIVWFYIYIWIWDCIWIRFWLCHSSCVFLVYFFHIGIIVVGSSWLQFVYFFYQLYERIILHVLLRSTLYELFLLSPGRKCLCLEWLWYNIWKIVLFIIMWRVFLKLLFIILFWTFIIETVFIY